MNGTATWTVAGILVIIAAIGGFNTTQNAAQLSIVCTELKALNPDPGAIPESAKNDCGNAGVPLD